MNRAEKIKKLLYRTFQESEEKTGSAAMDERILCDASISMKQAVAANQRVYRTSLWRIIMKSRRRKLATTAVIIFAVVLSVTILDRATTPAWAIGQTVEALKHVNGLVMSGTAHWDTTSIPFKIWIRPSKDNKDSFDMRSECEESIYVVRGKRAWAYWPDENLVKVYDDVTTSYGMMRDLQFWYDLAQLNPWITGKVLAAIKWVADDWKEVYGRDERTGRDCVFVTCSYKPKSKFWLVCDLKTKLVVEAKYWNWSCADMEGPPACHATSFAYKEKISDEIFEFQIPEGVKVIYKAQERKEIEESEALSNQAENLFHNEKKYAEALEVYQQVYDRFPKLNIAEEALMMIGLCHRLLGQHEKEIEAYQKAVSEYPNLKGLIETTYFYLGRAYMEKGQIEKALDAFEKCLAAGQGVRKPEQFPLKDAREYIAKIKTEQDSRQ
jgi:tetratricopeptide (TPR) repeat protein